MVGVRGKGRTGGPEGLEEEAADEDGNDEDEGAGIERKGAW